MKNKKFWFENENLWSMVTPVLFGEQHWLDARTEVENIIFLSGIKPRHGFSTSAAVSNDIL